ncbi:Coiled-coil domain-containing protein 12 [Borealophlyctis nickersoniae]|nr:Coiled-coil domain-containing protein 12 [Borealophlyctis nickersoniae]
MEDQARKRKERLAALRKAKTKASDSTNGEEQPEEQDEAPAKPTLRFRNYEPVSEDLQPLKQDAPAVGPNAKEVVETVEGQVEQFAREALEAEQQRSKEVDLFNLAPKKPNWDLKRDLEKKTEKLERRTQAAIADIIRERLRQEGNVSEMAGAADAARTAAADSDDEMEDA